MSQLIGIWHPAILLPDERWLIRPFYEHISGKLIAEREDVRDGTILIELAYGCPDFKKLDQLLARE